MNDWFYALTGFTEENYESTKSRLVFEGSIFYSTVNKQRYDIGTFEIPSLSLLRSRVSALGNRDAQRIGQGCNEIGECVCDAYDLHSESIANGGVIQVASQFNLLEMPSPEVTPEAGVTNYMYDGTQGPACAMAAGPATLFRNYAVPIGDQVGHTAHIQVNTLDLLLERIGNPKVTMKNGYLMCDRATLERINDQLVSQSDSERDELKSLLKVGVHWQTEVSAPGAPSGQKVTQVFCSALPIAYNSVRDDDLWESFARLVLEATYEATICVGVLNAKQTNNPGVFLTRVGGGVFGNKQKWIDNAIQLAVNKHHNHSLKVNLVSRK